MSSETWDYLAHAAQTYSEDCDPADDPFYEGIIYLLNRAASEAAVEFARLVESGVPERHARMVVQLSMEHSVAMGVAHPAIDADYYAWRKTQDAPNDTLTFGG